MVRPLGFLVCSLILLVVLTGCGSENALPTETAIPTESSLPPETTAPPETTMATEPSDPTRDILSRMSLREKVGQLFLVRPDALVSEQKPEDINNSKSVGVTALTDEMAAMLSEYPVGGIAMFAKNITSPKQIEKFTDTLQNASSLPLFMAIDEEGGTVARLANHKAFNLPQYKSVASVGVSDNPDDAWKMGSTIGAYLAEYGFNMDFAPVADVNTNPDNPVIKNRAFSSNGKTAAQMANAMAEGLRSQGIIATFKHFPGHGDTAEDSHNRLAVSYKLLEELMDCELLPFLEADSGDCIMVGHIAQPEVTGDMTPASLSHTLVTGLLKEALGFDGLVITDSLSMDAITDVYTPGDAAVSALQAGCHILLLPENMTEAFEAVVAAVEDGTLSMEWLDETVIRILEFKIQHGILKY